MASLMPSIGVTKNECYFEFTFPISFAFSFSHSTVLLLKLFLMLINSSRNMDGTIISLFSSVQLLILKEQYSKTKTMILHLPFWLGVSSIGSSFMCIPFGRNLKATSFWDSIIQKVSKPLDIVGNSCCVFWGSHCCYFIWFV